MTDVADTTFHLDQAPMATDRTAGWRFVREAGDVVYDPAGSWYLNSPEAVRFAHKHPEIFSSAKAFDVLGSPVPLVPIAIDPPDHKKFRRVLDPMLAPRVINNMEDSLRAQIRELIEAFVDRGHCDVVADVGRLYPTQVFLTLFGMPLDDRDQFIDWVETVVEGSSKTGDAPNEAVATSAAALFGYLQHHIDLKRQDPGDDLLSRVLSLEGDEAFSEEELLGLGFLFILAGLDTVTATIGFLMYHLAGDPGLRHGLTADPTLVGPTIEELLRLELPAPLTPRITTREVEVCGVTIPAGDRVHLCLATANRDPDEFEHPDTVDLSQGDRGHLSFGGGIHRCLGSHLARRELRLVLEEFHRMIPDYEIAEGVEPHIVWPSGTLHLTQLPLVFPPGGRA